MTDHDTDAGKARGRVRTEPSPKRVRAFLGGQLVADSDWPLLVWEVPYYPTYYFAVADVVADLAESGESDHSPSRGTGTFFDIHVEGASAKSAACIYRDSPIEELRTHVRLRWDAMDEWLEEDEPVYTHARDPHTRVDILASSRRVTVAVDGLVLADSSQPHILFETGLPPRYYLPLSHVRMDLLRPSDTVTHCPYKGEAHYWSVDVGGHLYEDLVWTYRTPLPECMKIAGLACFWNERVDLALDGVPIERARTHLS